MGDMKARVRSTSVFDNAVKGFVIQPFNRIAERTRLVDILRFGV